VVASSHLNIVYFGQSKLRKYDLNPELPNESLELIPDEEVYPKAPSHITTVSKPMDNNLFFKGHRVSRRSVDAVKVQEEQSPSCD